MRRLPPFLTALAILAALGSCSGQPELIPPPAQPLPVPAPAPAPAPTPTPPPARPLPAEWRDWPMAAGTWAYRQDARGSIALFGRAGEDAELTLRCDRARGRIYLSRRGAGTPGAPLTVRTSNTLRALAMAPTGGEPPYLAAELGVRDPLLDAIGHTRGRFAVEGGGLPPLAIPAWAELLRVIEDCRA